MTGSPIVGRLIVCTVCAAAVDVLEAATAARSEEEHRWIVPAAFVCGGCLDAVPLPEVETSTSTVEAAGRARTAQERAAWRDEAEHELAIEGRPA